MSDEIEYVACRKLFLRVISAENLPNLRTFLETRAYAKISIGSAERQIEFLTEADNDNGLNPAWSYSRAYEIEEMGVLHHGISVVIKLYAARTFKHDKYIGEVDVNIKKLFDEARSDTLHLPIMRGGSTEKTGATLNIFYSFGERYEVKKGDFEERVKSSGAWFKPEAVTGAAALAARLAMCVGVIASTVEH